MRGQDTDAEQRLSTEQREQLRLARRCFDAMERLASVSTSYPPGHRIVEEALDNLHDAFVSYFAVADTLSVRVGEHAMYLSETRQAVWETEAPADVCAALHRDGVFAMVFLTGLNREELRRFSRTLGGLVDSDAAPIDAANRLFEASFEHVDFEALDPSLAWLGGLDVELGEEDTPRERRAIDKLFARLSETGVADADTADTLDAKLRADRGASRERQHRQARGSEHVLRLPPAAQQELKEAREELLDAEQLEHRHAEMMAAILAANPKDALAERAVTQLGDLLVHLLETDAPWHALGLLKTVHLWRDDFDGNVTQRLRSRLTEHLDDRRIGKLTEAVANAGRESRQAILQMFDALHLDSASRKLVSLLEWDLSEEAERDLFQYFRSRASDGLHFIGERLETIPEQKSERLLDIADEALPATRPFLLECLRMTLPPSHKLRALEALTGHWGDSHEIRDYVTPLLESVNAELRIKAVEAVADGAPKHVRRVLEPLFDQDLADRPDEEIETLVATFARHGGSKALDKLESIIHSRGFVNEAQRDLAARIARSLLRVPTPEVAEMLQEVADDWLVPGSIRSACREVCDVIQ